MPSTRLNPSLKPIRTATSKQSIATITSIFYWKLGKTASLWNTWGNVVHVAGSWFLFEALGQQHQFPPRVAFVGRPERRDDVPRQGVFFRVYALRQVGGNRLFNCQVWGACSDMVVNVGLFIYYWFFILFYVV